MQLTTLDIDTFLRDYWQQRPISIRNPWDNWRNPLAPDALAGLACEDEIDSRLVTQTGKPGQPIWKVQHGPFGEAQFGKLGKTPWTLLVQAVDQLVPEVAALIDPFRFIPNWRIDDVMVSYATDGGGVGPHFDQYDVFLIQGLGRRRWQIGELCTAATPLLPHDDLRLLADFDPREEWLLEPGDMLYIPPGIAHNGVAVGDDCMTYSIGFRAPARSELIAHYCDHLLSELLEDNRYADPGLSAQSNPGEISAVALARLHSMVTERLADREAFARWFGHYSSTPKYAELDWTPDMSMGPESLRVRYAKEAALRRNPASRFMFVRTGATSLALFVDGQRFECDDDVATLAELLCAHNGTDIAPPQPMSDAALALLVALYNQGSVTFDEAP